MTQEDKLKAIISKAVENGYPVMPQFKSMLEEPIFLSSMSQNTAQMGRVLLFSHSFAKAIWGEDCQKDGSCKSLCPTPCWKFHLQIAVISNNPIDYYYENL